eukprot:CAMPEP_0171391826 /NCGR_PEP_ID=MMETSP0880-20121228/1538_1 /TAXON_ID=67004 /ORGANISM="Thalassiosira weissflogii, Strain CCMP1336" /LENGTH=767 /DNA_ID=CAMNT_0011904581 /DNA_START=340 /DNA_END=2643 /DNA_ORIENTATION=+
MSTEASPSGTPSPPAPPAPPATSPAAPSAGPSPLQIGKSFIKQYYKTLLEKPSQIQKFYQPDSILSRGMEPSAPTDPLAIAEALSAPAQGSSNGDDVGHVIGNDNGSTAVRSHHPSDTPAERIRKTFFEWAGKGIEELASSRAKEAADASDKDGDDEDDDVLRIDFERGAIDAQESVGGGILLVVTGHMFLPSSKPSVASPFVHTFFLNNGAPPGRKRQFYVRNDVLRFLLPVAVELEETAEAVAGAEEGEGKETMEDEEEEEKNKTGEGKEEEGGATAAVRAEVEGTAPAGVVEDTVTVEKEIAAVPPAVAATALVEVAEASLEVEEAVEETKAEDPESAMEPTPAASIPAAEKTLAEQSPAEVEAVTEQDSEPPVEVETPEEEAVEERKEEVVFEPNADIASPVDGEKADAEPTVSESAEASTSLEGKKKRYRRRRGGGGGAGGGKSSRSNSPPNGARDGDDAVESPTAAATAETKDEEPPPQQPEKPKTPGSWASLVAGGSGPALKDDGQAAAGKTKGPSKQDRRGRSPKGKREDKAASSASTNQHHHESSSAKAPPQSQQTSRSSDRTHGKDNTHHNHDPTDSASGPSATTTTTTNNTNPPPQSRMLSNQRTPEATLFIRNIPDATKEPEIRSLFESYGVDTGNRILGITLNANRGFCFVDFDGPAAVNAIVAEAQRSLVKDERTGRKIESSFMVHGRVLEVDQKIKTLQAGGGGGGAGGGGGGGGRRYNRSPPGSRGTRGMGMRRSPPRDGGRRASGGGGNR